MHNSSMDRMREFVETIPENKENPLTVLDVGSMDVCGTYRELFPAPRFKYTGLDLEAGKNVDVVATSAYDWLTDPETFDIVISGQCLEHVLNTHSWMQEVSFHLKPGGICCIIAPWQWDEHKFPVDCWRILPDGMRFLLADIGNLNINKVWKQENDCIGIATKPDEDNEG
jgi:SAM-dependent methyltransferase